MNPLYGVAVERERLRATGAEDTEPEVESATDAQSQAGDRWVTIDHRHVLIHEGQRLRLPTHSEFVVVPRFGHEVPISSNYRTENIRYEIEKMDRLGNVLPLAPEDGDHRVTLRETLAPDSKRTDVYICHSCESATPNLLIDTMGVTQGRPHAVIKRFTIDGAPAASMIRLSNRPMILSARIRSSTASREASSLRKATIRIVSSARGGGC